SAPSIQSTVDGPALQPASRLDDVRHAREPAQHAGELLEVVDRDAESEIRNAGVVIGAGSHGVDAEALERQHVGQITQQPAAIVGADGQLHVEPGAVRAAPFDLQHALGLERAHAPQARTVAAMDRDAPTEGDITGDRLRTQRRTAARQRGRQIAHALDLHRRRPAPRAARTRRTLQRPWRPEQPPGGLPLMISTISPLASTWVRGTMRPFALAPRQRWPSEVCTL